MHDEKLIHLPRAAKDLAQLISDKEWNGETVKESDYKKLEKWHAMIKNGVTYEARF